MNDTYSQEVYEILREFVPQVEKQLREELDTRYRQMYEEKLHSQIEAIEQEAERKYQEELTRMLKERESQIRQEYERMFQTRVRQLEKQNDEALRRFKQEMQDKKDSNQGREKQIASLLQQKANWEKLEKQYQKAIRQMGMTMKGSSSDSSLISEDTKQRPLEALPQNSSKDSRSVSNHKGKAAQSLKLDIPKDKEYDSQESSHQLYHKEEDSRASEYSSLLSPPHVEQTQARFTKEPSRQPKSLFWNEEKKKELLDMIRKRII